MLKVRHDWGKTYASIGYLGITPSFVQTPWFWYGDPVPNIFSSALFPCARMVLTDLLGAYPGAAPMLVQKFTTKPKVFPYDPNHDWAHFGSRQAGLQGFSDLLTGSPILAPIPGNETNGEHHTIVGDSGINFPQTSFLIPSGSRSIWGTSYPRSIMPDGTNQSNTGSRCFNRVGVRSGLTGIEHTASQFALADAPYPVYSTMAAQIEWLKMLCQGISPETRTSSLTTGWYTSTYSSSGNGLAHTNVNDMVISGEPEDFFMGSTPLQLSYTVVNSATWGVPGFPNQSAYSMRWHVDLSYRFVQGPTPPRTFHIPTAETILPFKDVGYLETSYKMVHQWSYTHPSIATKITSIVSTADRGGTAKESRAVLCDWPARGDEPGPPASRDDRKIYQGIEGFSHAVQEEIKDLLPSLVMSASDAFASVATIDSNNIENIVELRGIAESLPDLRAALALVSDVLKRDLSLSTISQVLDILSSEYLRWSFGTKPTVDFLTKGLEDLRAVDMSTINEPNVVGRGKFVYAFPEGTFGRSSSKLTAKTKVVYKAPKGFMREFLFGSQLYGVTPLPSNFWDLYPLSFVVDWYTGLGKRISDIEMAVYATVYDVGYYVHTLKVDSPLEDSELLAFGLTKSSLQGSTVPSYRLFNRYVSRYIPPYRDGRYDFRMPGNGPPWGLAAALFYQLFS